MLIYPLKLGLWQCLVQLGGMREEQPGAGVRLPTAAALPPLPSPERFFLSILGYSVFSFFLLFL